MRIERTHDEGQGLAAAVVRLNEVKKAREVLDLAVKDAEAVVIDLMHKSREKSYEVPIFSDGKKKLARATIVHAERVTVDGEGLKATLGTRKFNTVADYKVNQAKLTKAIEDGKIDQEVVAPFLTVKDSKPYIRLTEAEEEND
jgi:hypothetical protein